ncbi:hypothetical protein BN940_12966 [Castellaniella defragrans 65Phen]|uniref:Uncharacterized protein n=1 Tax=Castellaniella defragrans (strain DSM 12143 / CCUG 39792 / 65Phen) TaxID=1437824 RepID=W8WZ48_CASD6|nr:hypothetical protein BN940_12966 [Castellaniella defragrans 65Phen]
MVAHILPRQRCRSVHDDSCRCRPRGGKCAPGRNGPCG